MTSWVWLPLEKVLTAQEGQVLQRMFQMHLYSSLIEEVLVEGSVLIFFIVFYFLQPVLVSGMHKKMNFSLWKAESISLDFGNQQADILNCKDSIISNTNVKEFWDGFEDVSSTLL